MCSRMMDKGNENGQGRPRTRHVLPEELIDAGCPGTGRRKKVALLPLDIFPSSLFPPLRKPAPPNDENGPSLW